MWTKTISCHTDSTQQKEEKLIKQVFFFSFSVKEKVTFKTMNATWSLWEEEWTWYANGNLTTDFGQFTVWSLLPVG